MPTRRRIEGEGETLRSEIVEELQERLKDITAFFEELGGKVEEQSDIYREAERDMRRFYTRLGEVREVLEKKKVAVEELTLKLEKARAIYERLEDVLEERFPRELEELRKKLQEMSEIIERSSRSFGRMLAEGIPLEDLGRFGRTISVVGSALRRWFGITIPTTVSEMLRDLVRGIEDFNTRLLRLRETIPLAFIEAGEITRTGMFAIQQEIEGFARAMRMERREFLEVFRELRATGLLYAMNEYQRIMTLQDLYSQGEISARQFISGISDAIRELRGLAIALGMTDNQILRFTETWSRLLMTRDVDEVQSALVALQRRAVEGGIGMEQLTRFMEQLTDRTRWYGINLFELLGITRDLTELIRTGAITTQDFINALISARQQLSPDRAGTIFYFLANFSDDPAVRRMLEGFERSGLQPVLAVMYLMREPWERFRETWDVLTNEERRRITSLLERLGFVENGMIQWNRLIETANRFQAEFVSAVQRYTNLIPDPSVRFYMEQELLRQVGINVGSLQELAVTTSLATRMHQMTTEGIKEEMRARVERDEVLGRGLRELEKYTTLLTDAFSELRKTVGDLADFINREILREPQRVVPTVPSPIFAPELPK
jgi:hypothetical protein